MANKLLEELKAKAAQAREGNVLEHGGIKVFICAPTWGQAAKYQKPGIDPFEIALAMMQECVLDPETKEKMFANATQEDLADFGADFIMACMREVRTFIDVEASKTVQGNLSSPTSEG